MVTIEARAHPRRHSRISALTRWAKIASAVVATSIAVTSAPVDRVLAQQSAAGPGPRPQTVIYNGAGSAPRIGLIGDSAFAGIGVVNAFGPLRSFNFIYDAESCRRTVLASCRLGSQTPANALTTLRQRSGQWGSVLVMATGYNDPGTNFASAVDQIMSEAARQGIPKVMWLTLRTAPVGFVPASYRSTSSTFRDNNLILLQKAQQYPGRLVIADWAGYSANRNDWFGSDGIHFRPAGAQAAAQFVASRAGQVINGSDITPRRTGAPTPSAAWTYLRYGMGGTQVSVVQQRLLNAGINLPEGVTGTFSIGTVYAVQTFQRLHGLHPNGIIDETTAEALGVYSGPWSDVRTGAVGTTVTRIQRALIDRGIYVSGGATGRFSLGTYYAVQTFQRRQGLTVTGVVDSATARRLGLVLAPEATAIWTAISQGSTGPAVARAQRALMDAGVAVRGGADGNFSVWTLYAVQTFQRYNGLRVTGVIDVETAQKLGLFDLANPVATLPYLRLGSAGSAVSAAESALIAAGVYVRDGVDGVFRIGDYYAVQTFQRYHGLPVTGVIDVATAEALDLFALAAPVATWTNLKMGSSGAEVATAERALANAGVYVRDGADAVFRIGDYYAVQTFQRSNGLAVTGEIDVPTAQRLGLFSAPAASGPTSLLVASEPAPSVASSSAAPVPPPTTTTTTTIPGPSTTTTAATASVPDPTNGSIEGRAWLDTDGNGVQDAGELGLDGVTLQLRAGDATVYSTAVTDGDGDFEFVDVPEGTYELEADLPEGHTPTIADRVTPGQDPDEADKVDSDFYLDEPSMRTITDAFDLSAGTVEDFGLGLIPPPATTTSTQPATTTPSVTTTTMTTLVSGSTDPTTSSEPTGPGATAGPTTTTATTTVVAASDPPTTASDPTTTVTTTTTTTTTTTMASTPTPTAATATTTATATTNVG